MDSKIFLFNYAVCIIDCKLLMWGSLTKGRYEAEDLLFLGRGSTRGFFIAHKLVNCTVLQVCREPADQYLPAKFKTAK
jgi:hypothetical protein